MKGNTEWIPYGLVSLGTFGLLANEFIASWGSAATLGFAACNLVGLALLITTAVRRKNGDG